MWTVDPPRPLGQSIGPASSSSSRVAPSPSAQKRGRQLRRFCGRLVRPGPGPTSTYRRPLPHAQLFLGAGATATSTAAVGLDRLDDDSEATQATTKSQLRHAVDRSCSWFGSGRYTRGLGYVYLFDVLFRYLYLICIWITQD